MKSSTFLALCLALCVTLSSAFVAPRAMPVRHRAVVSSAQPRTVVSMGGKVAQFGPFSPAVYVAKIALGEKELNKLRGKAIALHSQVITYFCNWAGTQQRMRNRVVKLAKTNGDRLGFLV